MKYRNIKYIVQIFSFTILMNNSAKLKSDLEHMCAHSNESVVKFRKSLVGLNKKQAIAICVSDKISKKHSLNFDWPVDLCDFWISSLFGPRKHKGITKMHHGIDLASFKGTTVKASAAGKVVVACDDVSGYGSLVEIKHKKGFTTRYGHLDEILVEDGQYVDSGDIIGTVGSRGNVRGKKDPSHLHFEIRQHGQSLNPLKYLYCSEYLFAQ